MNFRAQWRNRIETFPMGRLSFFSKCVSQVEQKNNISLVFLFEFLILFFRVLSFTITRIQMQSVVIPQIGRSTLLNGITLFGSEIARLTGELLAVTTQTARYIRITCEPHLKTSTLSESHPR